MGCNYHDNLSNAGLLQQDLVWKVNVLTYVNRIITGNHNILSKKRYQ